MWPNSNSPMRGVLRITAAALLLSAATAHGLATGNDMHRSCEESGVSCGFFVMGAMEGAMLSRNWKDLGACWPLGVTMGQHKDTFMTYLKDHPEARHEPAVKLLHTALTEKWPCKR
jgi:hypothetical protein